MNFRFKTNVVRVGLALAFGAALFSTPAHATLISFTTSASPSTKVGTSGAVFTYNGATVGNFDPTTGAFFNASSATLSTTFGAFTYAAGSTGSNVIDIDVHPTVNGGAAATLDFKGTVTSAVVSGNTTYSINFGSTAGAIAGTGSLAGYTELVSNGVTYAIKTAQTLNVGKSTFLSGYVGGIPLGQAPEPAPIATTGLALVAAGLIMRHRHKKAKN